MSSVQCQLLLCLLCFEDILKAIGKIESNHAKVLEEQRLWYEAKIEELNRRLEEEKQKNEYDHVEIQQESDDIQCSPGLQRQLSFSSTASLVKDAQYRVAMMTDNGQGRNTITTVSCTFIVDCFINKVAATKLL